ncbi:unnamed protein product [Medioppia subpectinata]|uniref:Ion transport domain-containing protein n=1 Tax=Medioppia subpectinata TaxID=1979941 RepID=A0A7R9KK66_9ACAR|nr:unnamed protein product [Medioppia subpectinata]CAG2103695.1 unnamed protein product [Medioppia subpectinata]
MDSFLLTLLTSEFIVRLWSCSIHTHFRGWRGKIRYLCSPYPILDLTIILVAASILYYQSKAQILSIALRGVKIFQVFESRFRTWRLIVSVVWDQRLHLAITFYIALLILLLVSFLMHLVEKDVNDSFNTLPASMWWTLITMSTIGYGDAVPETTLGKFIACLCILVGVSIFALPAGILGTGLALKVEKQNRHKRLNKRRAPAAQLIQYYWRWLATDRPVSGITITIAGQCPVTYYMMNSRERHAYRFIVRLRYLSARTRFRCQLNQSHDLHQAIDRYASGQSTLADAVRVLAVELTTVRSDPIIVTTCPVPVCLMWTYVLSNQALTTKFYRLFTVYSTRKLTSNTPIIPVVRPK